jgi:hypothetical protein
LVPQPGPESFAPTASTSDPTQARSIGHRMGSSLEVPDIVRRYADRDRFEHAVSPLSECKESPLTRSSECATKSISVKPGNLDVRPIGRRLRRVPGLVGLFGVRS